MPRPKPLVLLLFSSAAFAYQPTVELTPLTVTAVPEQVTGRAVLERDAVARQLRTLGETLEQLPGFSNQSFGPGVGLPVIRGQSGPRVRVLQNALGVNDLSQISPDHALGLEPLFAEQIEVLHGPAALRYGSGIVGGLVNVQDRRIPQQRPPRPIVGSGEYRYASPADEHAGVAYLEASGGPYVLHLEGLRRAHGDLATGRGVLERTDGDTRSGSAGISWVGERGFAGAAIQRLENTYGVPNFEEEPLAIDLRQTRYDFRARLDQPWSAFESLFLGFGYTDYHHLEIEDGARGTLWTQRAYESRLELSHQPLGPITGSLGIQTRHADLAALGEEAIVPRTETENYALFFNQHLERWPFRYEWGAHVEHQQTRTEDHKRRDLPVSGAASVSWQVNGQNRLSLAFTSTQRAPAPQELFSFGVHNASQSFEIGNPELDLEHAHLLELGYRFEHPLATLELNFFHYWVNDFIFFRNTGKIDPDSGLPIFVATQQDAVFKGFEAQAHLPVLTTARGDLELILFGDYTRGRFQRGGDVPRMPPLRYGLELNFHRTDGQVFVRLTRAEPQDHPGQNEAPTPGYALLNLGGEYRFSLNQHSQLSIFAQATNLLDQTVRSSTSFLRTIAPEAGRGAQVGVKVAF